MKFYAFLQLFLIVAQVYTKTEPPNSRSLYRSRIIKNALGKSPLRKLSMSTAYGGLYQKLIQDFHVARRRFISRCYKEIQHCYDNLHNYKQSKLSQFNQIMRKVHLKNDNKRYIGSRRRLSPRLDRQMSVISIGREKNVL